MKRILATLCAVMLCFMLHGCKEQTENVPDENTSINNENVSFEDENDYSEDGNDSLDDEGTPSDDEVNNSGDGEQNDETESAKEWEPIFMLSAAEGYCILNRSIYNEINGKYYELHDGVLEEVESSCNKHQISFVYEGQQYNVEFETLQIGTKEILLQDTVFCRNDVEVADISDNFQQVILRLRYDTLLYYDGTKTIELVQASGIHTENLHGCFVTFAENNVVISVTRMCETESDGVVSREYFSNILLYNPTDSSFEHVIEEMSDKYELKLNGRYARFYKDNEIIIMDLFSGREVKTDYKFSSSVVMNSITDNWLLVQQMGETKQDFFVINVLTGNVLPIEVTVSTSSSPKIVYCAEEVYFSVKSQEGYKLYLLEL